MFPLSKLWVAPLAAVRSRSTTQYLGHSSKRNQAFVGYKVGLLLWGTS